MSSLLTDFERACADAQVSPAAALKEGGVHPSLWSKWKAGKSPTLKNFERAQHGLERLKRNAQRVEAQAGGAVA